MQSDEEVTRLLAELGEGNPAAMDRLLPLVYDELLAMARRRLAGSTPHRTLDTTSLVHEAYIKLSAASHPRWANRNHFYAVAARAMRQVVVDYARRCATVKRGGDIEATTLDESRIDIEDQAAEILALDEALDELSQLGDRLSQTVELRFFGGLSVEETAGVLGVSVRTVKRDWQKARAVLHQALSAGGEAS